MALTRVTSESQGADDLAHELRGAGFESLPEGVMVYAIEGPFFFGAVENFEQALSQIHLDPRFLILRLGRVPFMNITGLQAMDEAIHNLERRGVMVLLCEGNPRGLKKLHRAGMLLADKQRHFKDLREALAATR